MALAAKKAMLGKRTRRGAATEHQGPTEPPRASKRLREQREARGSSWQSQSGASNTTIRHGLATPEASSVAESQKESSQSSLSSDEAPLELTGIFPFMQLPAELRIHIYHMALHRDSPLYLHAARAPDKEVEEGATPDADAQALACAVDGSTRARRQRAPSPAPDMTPPLDAVAPTILRLNQQIYKEARSVLYSANTFTLSLVSGIHTLSTLHQRSRSLIKHVILTIPSHHDILDGFADLVRLGLRYCWGLKTFKIILQASLPDDGRMTHATSVYANAFHILRWLPRGCKVVLEGNVSEVVRDVVREEGRLQNVLDDMGYAKRQHQMPERH